MLNEAGFFHHVFFWPPEGGEDTSSRLIEGCKAHLPSIPGVVRLSVGVPAGPAREVVDNSFCVALLIEFVDRAAHDVYQEHPNHLRFLAECRQYWSRVRIYDVAAG